MSVDLGAVKAKQQVAWSSGYNDVGIRLVLMAERLCEAADLRYGERVLDIACGNGNVALAAARRFADVVGVDFAPPMLDHARERARVEGLDVEFRVGDAEALEFGDGDFDAVLSSIGAMFAPDQEAVARELLRVTKPGGRIALANWVPGGFVAALFATVGKHVPPPPGLRSPAAWGDEQRLRELFGADAKIDVRPEAMFFHAASADAFVDWFRGEYGPTAKAFQAVGEDGAATLHAELADLVRRFDVSGDDRVKLRSDYVEVVVRKG